MFRSNFSPRVWQPQIIDFIAEHPRCAIWAKMGAGKTTATLKPLTAIRVLEQGPALILGPKRVARKTWPDEMNRWTFGDGFRVVPVIGNLTERFQALGESSTFYSINYEMLPWLVKHFGRNWPFKTVVADEATKLKGFRLRGGGQRAAALAKVAHTYCERFIELTGTPSPNGLQDLWGEIWFLDKGERLGRTYQAFTDRWFGPNPNGYGLRPFPYAQEQIQKALADICLTVDPADYLTLTPVVESDIVVTLPPKARRHYAEMERQMFTELDHDFGVHEIEAVNAAVRTNKCLQIASGALYTDAGGSHHGLHDEKLDALESIVEEACGEPVLVSCMFKSEFKRIAERFPKARHFDDKPETEDAWNRGEIELMYCHPASAGHGSNLQHGGRILVDFGSGWNLEYDDQIVERLGPMRQFQSGYDRPVYRYRIVAENTVDYMVKARRETKRSVQDILLEAMKGTKR
ncbi:MAG: SNF2-related protein [Casimicrobium sp.]